MLCCLVGDDAIFKILTFFVVVFMLICTAVKWFIRYHCMLTIVNYKWAVHILVGMWVYLPVTWLAYDVYNISPPYRLLHWRSSYKLLSNRQSNTCTCLVQVMCKINLFSILIHTDPRKEPADSRQGPADPYQRAADPRQGPWDPRQKSANQKQGRAVSIFQATGN